MRNNLYCYVFRFRTRFVTHIVDVPAAQIGEALAYTVGFECAVVVVHRERSLCDCDQTRARMGMPPGLTVGLKSHLRNIKI